MLQARALEACHRAEVEVVIKSGRREPQVLEDARADRLHRLHLRGRLRGDDRRRGDGPGRRLRARRRAARSYETIVDRGVPELLFESFAPALEWHAPLAHRSASYSHLFRGKIDVGRGQRDPRARGPRRPEADRQRRDLRARWTGVEGRAHAYHLMPAAASKANAVAFHMRARGYAPEECIAIGDSVEDLAVAEVVGRFFVPANGPERDPGLREAIRPPNVTVTEGRWATASTRRSSRLWPAPSHADLPRHPGDRGAARAGLRPTRTTPATPGSAGSTG